MVRISKFMKSTNKNAVEYSIPDALLKLKTSSSNYENLNPDFNRIYGDIDGKNIEGDEETFNKLDTDVRDCIETFLGNQKYVLMTASSYLHNKISWRFVITNYKTTPAENKRWVQNNVLNIDLPEGISFDFQPYSKNQKMRMLNSNKDDEIRPLRLVEGEPIDTLISYIPEDCIYFPVPLESKKTKQVVSVGMSSTLVEALLSNIPNTIDTTWEHWYKVAQAVFNEGGTIDMFMAWSSKSPKHTVADVYNLWKGLKNPTTSGLTGGSLIYWSSQNVEAHEKIVIDNYPKDSYIYIKVMFEKTHFKLVNPPCFVNTKDGLHYLTDQNLGLLYQNYYFSESLIDENGDTVSISKRFIDSWKDDVNMRTISQIVFKPKLEVQADEYNLFQGFSIPAVEGDTTVAKDLLWLVSGKEQKVYDYLLNYLAHMIQKPYQNPKIALVFFTKQQGAGKDTIFDSIGKILGNDYFFNTGDAENQVFSRFNGHLQSNIFLKMEEVEFETNKSNESKLMSMITADNIVVENKGQKPIMLDNYKRIIMTTNKETPLNVPQSDRRFVLVNSSEDRVGDRQYWENIYKNVLTQSEFYMALHYMLLNHDITNFNPNDRPITEFYKEVKTTMRPYHASYFQDWISNNGDSTPSSTSTSTDWLDAMNVVSKFKINQTKFGRDIKVYPDECFTKNKTKYNNTYTLHTSKMYDFLVKQGWWAE